MALDFPSASELPNQNPKNTFSPSSTPKSSSNGLTYLWNGQSWDLKIPEGGDTGAEGVQEAPQDGQKYMRKDAAWVVFDDKKYVKNNVDSKQTISSDLETTKKFYSETTVDSDDPKTLTTKTYVEDKFSQALMEIDNLKARVDTLEG